MEYKYFTFDGISSEKYNLLIQNKGEDLLFPSQASFENQMVSPLYQGTSYLVGVNKKDRIFNFNCWVDSISVAKTREMLNWLSVNKKGFLELDYNENFRYKVKIAAIGDFKHLPINADNTNNYEFSLSFTTIDDFAAQSKDSYTNISGNNPDGFLRGSISNYDTFFYNTYNLPFYINFNINSAAGFMISKNDIPYYQYSAAGIFNIDSRYGICVDSNNKIIEETLAEGSSYINLGPLLIDSNTKSEVWTVNENGIDLNYSSSFQFTETMRIYTEKSTKLYTYLDYFDIATDLNLSVGDEILVYYFEPTKITLTPGITYSFNYRDNF